MRNMLEYRTVGARICVCFDVSDSDALQTWQVTPRVGELTRRFSCGDNCGMCLPYFAERVAVRNLAGHRSPR